MIGSKDKCVHAARNVGCSNMGPAAMHASWHGQHGKANHEVLGKDDIARTLQACECESAADTGHVREMHFELLL